MSQRTTDLTNDDIETLALGLNTILNYVASVEDFSSLRDLLALVEDCVNRRDGRALRLLKRDIEEGLIALTKAQRAELESIMLDRVPGWPKRGEDAVRARARQAVRRGVIRSEKERDQLARALEALQKFRAPANEIKALRRLLEA